jgi:hypothetical protein
MNKGDLKIDRLLRSAAQTRGDVPAAMPFGFDTRMVALWHAKEEATSIWLARLVRRIALLSTAVIVISTLAAVREARQSREQFGDPFTNEFAIADSAIQDEFLK